MATALRRLGVFLFCLGAIAVVVALIPVMLVMVEKKNEQICLAISIVGGLLVISGLVIDWLGSQLANDRKAEVVQQPESRPPTMKISSKPAGSRGYREDLMA